MLVGLAGVLALVGCQEQPASSAAAVKAPAGDVKITLAASTIPDMKPVAGEVTTRRMGDARARISGTLTRLNVKEGDAVREGQVIGLVVDQRLRHETSAYDAQAAAAEAEAARARADLARYRTLHEKGFYNKAGLDQAEAQARAADASLRAARAQRSASAEMSSQGAILAPATGRVLRADVPAGSVVTAGQSVALVTAGEPLIRIEIPEAQGRALKVGDIVALNAEDLPGVSQGVVAQVYPAVAQGRVAADIRALGLQGDFVGQRVRARIKVGERQALVLPRRFVSTRFGIDYVRLADKKGQLLDVAVQLAPGPDTDSVEILSGLAAGDVVYAPGAGQ